MDETARRIVAKRKELGFTMDELAKKVGVTASTINKWEKGQIKNIQSAKFAKLAKALECSPSYLMGFSDVEVVIEIEKLPPQGRMEILSYYKYLLEKYNED